MEQYAMYLRKSRFDRDYAELSVEETLKRHKAILDRTAEERRYYIAQIYYEVVSGESIAARPEIQKLLEAVGNELYAGVLVVDLERLARGNSADQAYISQVFQFSSTKIITPAKTYDPNNEYDEDFFEFGLFMSRREYKTINRRLLRGRDSSASEGKYISSIAPYGYQKKKLENRVDDIDSEELDATLDRMEYILQCWEDWNPRKWEPAKNPDWSYADPVPLMYSAGSHPNEAWGSRGIETPTSMRSVDASCEAEVLTNRYVPKED